MSTSVGQEQYTSLYEAVKAVKKEAKKSADGEKSKQSQAGTSVNDEDTTPKTAVTVAKFYERTVSVGDMKYKISVDETKITITSINEREVDVLAQKVSSTSIKRGFNKNGQKKRLKTFEDSAKFVIASDFIINLQTSGGNFCGTVEIFKTQTSEQNRNAFANSINDQIGQLINIIKDESIPQDTRKEAKEALQMFANRMFDSEDKDAMALLHSLTKENSNFITALKENHIEVGELNVGTFLNAFTDPSITDDKKEIAAEKLSVLYRAGKLNDTQKKSFLDTARKIFTEANLEAAYDLFGITNEDDKETLKNALKDQGMELFNIVQKIETASVSYKVDLTFIGTTTGGEEKKITVQKNEEILQKEEIMLSDGRKAILINPKEKYKGIEKLFCNWHSCQDLFPRLCILKDESESEIEHHHIDIFCNQIIDKVSKGKMTVEEGRLAIETRKLDEGYISRINHLSRLVNLLQPAIDETFNITTTKRNGQVIRGDLVGPCVVQNPTRTVLCFKENGPIDQALKKLLKKGKEPPSTSDITPQPPSSQSPVLDTQQKATASSQTTARPLNGTQPLSKQEEQHLLDFLKRQIDDVKPEATPTTLPALNKNRSVMIKIAEETLKNAEAAFKNANETLQNEKVVGNAEEVLKNEAKLKNAEEAFKNAKVALQNAKVVRNAKLVLKKEAKLKNAEEAFKNAEETLKNAEEAFKKAEEAFKMAEEAFKMAEEAFKMVKKAKEVKKAVETLQNAEASKNTVEELEKAVAILSSKPMTANDLFDNLSLENKKTLIKLIDNQDAVLYRLNFYHIKEYLDSLTSRSRQRASTGPGQTRAQTVATMPSRPHQPTSLHPSPQRPLPPPLIPQLKQEIGQQQPASPLSSKQPVGGDCKH